MSDLSLLLPEAALAAGVVAILAADLVLPKGGKGASAWIGVAACALALLAAAVGLSGEVSGMLTVDGLLVLARPMVLICTVLVLLAGRAEQGRDDDFAAWAACIVGLGLGGLICAGASSLITLYLGLELMSLAGYALAGWKGGDRRAAEAGMKYVLFGGAASGLMLFGMSHVYGLTGHLDFAGIGLALADAPVATLAALCLAGVGIAYKLAVVPFHFYAPDVYQGAPALSVAALGVVPKLAATAALARALLVAVPPTAGLPTTLAVLGVVSLLVAAFTALGSRDAKRIIAFSAIGHAGAVLLALAAMPGSGALPAAAFYLAAYAVANIGALVCLAVLERERGSASLEALAGSMRRRPWLTAALCLFLFSLAGVPPLAGFLAKWGVLRELLHGPLAWAGLVLLASTALSAWAYLLIVRAAVLQSAPEEPRPPRLEPGTVAVLAVCAAATLALGLWLDGFAALGRVLGR